MQIDTPAGIVSKFPRKLFAIRSSNMYQLKDDLQHYTNCNSVHLFGQFLHYTDVYETVRPEEIQSFIENKGHQHIYIEEIKPGIEDCFYCPDV